jgi:hypothetical protein
MEGEDFYSVEEAARLLSPNLRRNGQLAWPPGIYAYCAQRIGSTVSRVDVIHPLLRGPAPYFRGAGLRRPFSFPPEQRGGLLARTAHPHQGRS